MPASFRANREESTAKQQPWPQQSICPVCVRTKVCQYAHPHLCMEHSAARGLPGSGGIHLPLDRAFLPYLAAGARTLTSRYCRAPEGCPAVLALPALCPGGRALQFWLLVPYGQGHTGAARHSPKCAPRNLLQEYAFTWDMATRQRGARSHQELTVPDPQREWG